MGIEIEFISSEVLKDKEGEARMKYILRRIKKDKILVIDGSLTALEETMLIEKTMSAIDDKFKGIEISTLRGKTEGSRARTSRSRESRPNRGVQEKDREGDVCTRKCFSHQGGGYARG